MGAAIICAHPGGEEPSDPYQVRVDGHPAFVHSCRASAVPFNQEWPGYQRPMDQTERAAFACWGMAGERPSRTVALTSGLEAVTCWVLGLVGPSPAL